MTGTVDGGKSARNTNLKRHGRDFYARIGALGGKGDRGQRVDKGFASMDPEKHRRASSLGGRNGKPYTRTERRKKR